MCRPWHTGSGEGRHSAAFFSCVVLIFLLAGCGSGASALRGTLEAVVPWQADVSQRAGQLSYASIKLLIDGSGGLVVLAELSRDNAYFQLANYETIVLEDGYLDRTAGLPADLLVTRVRGVSGKLEQPPWRAAKAGVPFEYRVQRQWRGVDGRIHADRARATLVCEPTPRQVELPLASLALQRCHESLVWSDGTRTESILWRLPEDHRLWSVRTVPWPGAPVFEWEVARPWW